MDYGMENCSVTLSTPQLSGEFEQDAATVRIKHGDSAELDVWSLDQHSKMNYQELSWNTIPHRIQHLGTLKMTYGISQQLPGFPCHSGTFETIEISCRGDCDVELNVTKKEMMGSFSLARMRPLAYL